MNCKHFAFMAKHKLSFLQPLNSYHLFDRKYNFPLDKPTTKKLYISIFVFENENACWCFWVKFKDVYAFTDQETDALYRMALPGFLNFNLLPSSFL